MRVQVSRSAVKIRVQAWTAVSRDVVLGRLLTLPTAYSVCFNSPETANLRFCHSNVFHLNNVHSKMTMCQHNKNANKSF